MYKLVEDLSVLTTIDSRHISKLVDKSFICINDYVQEAIIQGENVINIDIGLGNLLINIDNNQLKYKFIPNNKLEKSIKETYINRANTLERTIESTLINRITNIYKDLL